MLDKVKYAASVWKCSESEAKAWIEYLAHPDVQAELKRFREYFESPEYRTSAYEGCLNLMRDPPAGMWADGSPMRTKG